MGYRSDPRLLVLHGLRLAGVSEAESLAERTGVPAAGVESQIAQAEASGWARWRDGRMAGWSLTPAGRAEGGRRLAAELDQAGARDSVGDAYRRFAAVNHDLLAVCTAWQVVDEGANRLNDHSDAAYDEAVIRRLAAIDGLIQPVCADLALVLDRFGGYGPRLATALARVEAGEHEWFTGPTVDSYHTVWFELHEDLLATLGVERSKEASA